MSEVLLRGDPPISVVLRRSTRARRMTIRVSRLDGKVTLTVPEGVRERAVQDFAKEREGWIRENLSGIASVTHIRLDASVPVLGIDRRIVQGHGRRIQLTEDELQVPGSPEQTGRKVQAWLKQLARSELVFASDQYAKALGRTYTKFTLRDAKSRWGSCTSEGGLMYSWRLIMAPAEVLAYVAAHEVAHLAEMNHSRAFWATVEDLYGDYRPARRWLKKDGVRLHAYRFTD